MTKRTLIWIIVILVVAVALWWYFNSPANAPSEPSVENMQASDDTTSINQDLQGIEDTSTIDNEFKSIDKDLNSL